MLEKNIKFYPIKEFSEDEIPFPSPASKFVPEWFRKTQPYINKDYGPIASCHYSNQVSTNLTVKRCVPVFDSITSGYMITLPADIVFSKKEPGTARALWSVSYDVIGSHSSDQIGNMSLPEGCSELFKWIFYFRIQTPPGYSCMFSHPNFSYDSPFITLPGVVDTDKHPLAINFPFFIKDDFEGIIKKGTPICQIIPFKRDSWKMKKENFDKGYSSKINNFYSIIEKSYRNRFWSKKVYK